MKPETFNPFAGIRTFAWWRDFAVHGEVYLFAWLGILFAWRTLLPMNNVIAGFLGEEGAITKAFGIVSPGSPHQLSYTMIFLFGLYFIRTPYYKVDNKMQFFVRFVQSFFAVALATTATEGSWDIVYAYKYLISTNPALVAGVVGGIALCAEVTTVSAILKVYKLFHMKRVAIVLGALSVYYLLWYVGLGFSTSGAPDLSPSLTVAVVELGHWALGIGGFAWAIRRSSSST